MILSAPSYGNSPLGFKVLLDGLKIPYVLPSKSNRSSLELGAKYAPEGICQPFKMMLGNAIKSIEEGADTIVLIATNGPCKFGEYAGLQERLLKKAGYDASFIVLCTENGRKAFMKEIHKVSSLSSCSKYQKIIALKRALRALSLMDAVESQLRYLSGFELQKGSCKDLLLKCSRDVYLSREPKQILQILKHYQKKAKTICVDPAKKPLRIALVGEIYTISEPFSNQFIEDHLMAFGASVSRSLTPSWWFKDRLLRPLKINSLKIRKAAKEYIYESAGGYTKETVGHTLLAHKQGFDGAIQIFPVGCTPEIIAKPILEKIASDKGFPILTLIVDEMTGEEGFLTRLEAFMDLLERRRRTCI
ncbi:MAG: 2-hydroxyglutaryl-CoA dehydratase [Vallitaleaceae bacterium]|nr:2-hydroxyglutaryl-CoA dehydratase [Vallitaleaceae bacterium]